MITIDTIQKDTVFVAKMQGYRKVGTFAEIGNLADDPDCRDFDLCAKQPDHLTAFYDAYWEYEMNHPFMDVNAFYNEVWVKSQKRLTKWNGKKWILPQNSWREIAERLAAYENTGLEPEECFPAPKFGKWIAVSKICCKCSACNESFWHQSKDWIPDKFCPECGAKMEGVQE